MRMTLPILIFSFLLLPALGFAGDYKPYPYDRSGFEKHPELGKEWDQLNKEWAGKIAPSEVLQRQLNIMEEFIKKEPKWIEGYWHASHMSFELGMSSFKDKKNRDKIAKPIFEKGVKYAKKCLKIQKDNPLCKFYLGVNMGKSGVIDGVLRVLRNAAPIRDMWVDVTKSPYNHMLKGTVSLQGATRHGLGIWYRLVPDWFLLDWIFDARGDIDRSVAFHKESMEIDTPDVCRRTQYAAALLCRSKRNGTQADKRAGLAQLGMAVKLPVTNGTHAACHQGVFTLRANPMKNSCGFDPLKQQDTSKEEFEKQNPKEDDAKS